MSKTIKIEIEIPVPPEGCGEVEYRKAVPGDYCLGNGGWVLCTCATNGVYPVARKLAPPWTPPPEWHAMFGDCWLTRDLDGEIKLSKGRPVQKNGWWSHYDFVCFLPKRLSAGMMPPANIPWDKCCFKIGEPDDRRINLRW